MCVFVISSNLLMFWWLTTICFSAKNFLYILAPPWPLFLPHWVAYRILVPLDPLVLQPGIEPVPPAVEAQSPNHWPTR